MRDTLEQIAWQLFKKQFKKHNNLCRKVVFKAGSTIVKNGVFKTIPHIDKYAAVPLSYIVSGSVSIIQNGIAVKQYNQDECIGLFETSCFLEEGISDRIGRWDVIANTDVTLLVSSEKFLDHVSKNTINALLEAARSNPVAKPLSKLPLIDWFAMTHNIKPQKNLIIVYHSHIVLSSQEFIKHLAYIAGPENTFVLEKPYSTIPEAFSKLAEGGIRTYQLKIDSNMSYEYSIKRNVDYFWREIQEHVHAHKVKKIIVISDGADVLLSPVIKELSNIDIIGVEQTERGNRRLANSKQYFPIISIANIKAKKKYESPIIAAAALAKIESEWLLNSNFSYGVVGAGSIGREVIRLLNDHGIAPLVYDPISVYPSDYLNTFTLENLVQKSDIIIGTTGTDCLRGMFIEKIKGKKTFISTSSSNIEFDYLFDLAKTYANRFEDVTLQISKLFTAIILNGGYPINFDRSIEWEPLKDIQLTRALIYAAVYEALINNSTRTKLRTLQPKLETKIINKWLQIRR